MIRFRVLGSLDLRGQEDEEILSVLSQPKRTAVLAYLALAIPRGFHRRDRIVGLFWPDSDQEHARASLRRALHFLRRSLGDGIILGRGDEEIGLDWDEVWLDASAFEKAVKGGDPEEALDIYRGDLLGSFFLSGCPGFDEWLEEERSRLREMATEAAWQIAFEHTAEGRIVDAERVGQFAIGLDPAKEAMVRDFVQALAQAGDRAAAVSFFETFASRIREKLELEPSSETLAVISSLRGTVGPGIRSEADPSNQEGPTEDIGNRNLLDLELGPELEVLRLLGTGSVGDVYLVRQKPLDRLVTVKVLKPDVSADTAVRTRFQREAKAAASLDHPNAVTVHRVGALSNGVPYMVMQYVKGSTLEERLAAEGPLQVAEAREILAQVASALAAAHVNGFVHRDVHPGNVLWDNQSGRALLSDFGLAGVLPEKEGTFTRVTKAGEILGNLKYLSPEQFLGNDPSEGADIYALAVMGYEILTGRGPFVAANDQQLAMAHMRQKPTSVSVLRPEVDTNLADLLVRCLEKEVRKRPTAAFLAKALREGSPSQGRA